ncbi:MAG: spermidine/putrescine ABC transporter substrate-binding protein [Peptostreptococcus porci]|nr:spermidine/putrescine ABC transporter substrate-binding protein [Peptostreptococcus porci]MDD7183091.1 spermidine/putrescine ABC transporter substrate-binding protein [Peptostreptococcus porci]MDY2795286.1 spermidine/putrescine ABC transporter substrate-binding protein [Peptostreptococcus porci]MDY5435776.1 spermidine/putrescine ABC transporter substrate-binding protein [Peptostreptococcus porci]MDY5479498.1 spermidine/putrescine ABC transporter substrate-binding protein [Peptostreptococcus 
MISAVLSSSILFAGCGATSQSSSKVLNVYNVGDYIDEELINEFEEKTGIKVQYSTYDTNEMMYQKVKSGSTKYDLVFPSDYMVQKMSREGLLKKINYNNIPNYKYVDKDFLKNAYDPTNEYSVPYMWGTLGIVYNKKMVKDKVDSWDILWNSKYRKNILMFDSVRDTMGVALKKLGYSMNTTNQDEINKAKDLLTKQKDLVLAYVNDDGKDRMVGNEAMMGIFYSGDVPMMIEENEDLAYVIPKEGSNKWTDAMCIPKTSDNQDWAEEFINFLCDPDVNARNTEYIGYSTPIKKGWEQLPDDVKYDKSLYPDEEILSKCEAFLDLEENIKKYDRAWVELKSN